MNSRQNSESSSCNVERNANRSCSNVIEVDPQPLDEDGLLKDSRRIKEETKREMWHERHIDGRVNQMGGVEEYMKMFCYDRLITERFG